MPSADATTVGPDPDPSTIEAPVKADGSPYRYEMLHAGMTRRAYADDLHDFLDVLIPGYSEGTYTEQWADRLVLAARAQVYAQAVANTAPAYASVSVNEQAILSGPRDTPVVVPTWECPIPLVLIATDYAPAGRATRPQPVNGMPPNIIWIDPSDEQSLLAGLDAVEFIALHVNGVANTPA